MLSRDREKGQGTAEYTLVLVTIIGLILILRLLGRIYSDKFVEIVCTMTNPEAPCATEPLPSCHSERPLLARSLFDVTVQITSPQHCDDGLSPSITVSGTYDGNLTGREIWVLIFPTDSKYYPQTPDPCQQLPATIMEDTWTTTVNFGGPPQQYDVVAVVTDTDSEASLEFKRWLQSGCETHHYPGYLRAELPAGISELDAITVSKGNG
ncbi:MAG: hypothetical protein KDI79_24655 [Anaerolineae bacterium]|nr:hypothetical protein [Anaerolineae bacterium]